MAEKKYSKRIKKSKKIQESDNSNFGHYSMDTGGGKPFKKGDTTTRTTKANGKERQESNDTMQPRTKDGKFTYNSTNGKKLKYKSRGKTVNPLLTGGENGIMIEDVEKEFAAEKGKIWDKYKDKWYRKGGMKSEKFAKNKHKMAWHTVVAGEAIWNVAKRSYDSVKGEFRGESKVFDTVKKGKPSLDETTSRKLAEKSKQQKYVIDSKNGAIKIVRDNVPPPTGGGNTVPPVPPSANNVPLTQPINNITQTPVNTAPVGGQSQLNGQNMNGFLKGPATNNNSGNANNSNSIISNFINKFKNTNTNTNTNTNNGSGLTGNKNINFKNFLNKKK